MCAAESPMGGCGVGRRPPTRRGGDGGDDDAEKNFPSHRAHRPGMKYPIRATPLTSITKVWQEGLRIPLG